MMVKKNCVFQIPRGLTARYVYVFYYRGNYYDVVKKVLYGNLPYQVISTVKIPTKNIYNYINTVVANTY
jgi:hypothetical protein